MTDEWQLEYGEWASENVRSESYRKISELLKPDAPVRPSDLVDITGLHINVIVKTLLRRGYLRRLGTGTSFEASLWDFKPDLVSQVRYRTSSKTSTGRPRGPVIVEAVPSARSGRPVEIEKLKPQMTIHDLQEMARMLGFELEMRLVQV